MADTQKSGKEMSTPTVTERVMLDRLRGRYGGRSGNGYRWVFATHVRDAAGFDASRTADAVALDLWPSKGLELHGFEVKVSRSDWLRELAKPDKHVPVARFCDRWWLVVPDRTIVHSGELPKTWGLIECREPQHVDEIVGRPELTEMRRAHAASAASRVVHSAPKRFAEPLSRSFVAALTRATMKTALADAGMSR